MVERRADGELENDVLGVLWATDDALTPGEVNEALGADLAYTTVMTVLTRLWRKGLLERTRRGRAYAYRALVSESDLALRRLNETLAGASDRAEVLARFVGSLSRRDVAHLRRILDRDQGR
jgi:predicted transcriptional regulator